MENLDTVSPNASVTAASTPAVNDNDNMHANDNGVDSLLKHEPPARKKTWGEKLFNIETYAGVALLGNEATSLVITENVKPGKRWSGAYQKFEGWFSRARKDGSPILHEYVTGNAAKELKPRLPYLLVATIGGMFMVPFVKYLEDHKGEIVRKHDKNHYGSFSDVDPKLIEAHKEMDEAPKQSWGSLIKGRVTTVFAAMAADFGFGWDHALSTKLFKSEHASLNGMARWVASKSPKKYEKVAENGTWLLLLSSTLTVLFYASSKVFAKRSEEKQERKAELKSIAQTPGAAAAYADSPEASAAVQADASSIEKPTAQVRNISREDTVASAPQLSQAMN